MVTVGDLVTDEAHVLRPGHERPVGLVLAVDPKRGPTMRAFDAMALVLWSRDVRRIRWSFVGNLHPC